VLKPACGRVSVAHERKTFKHHLSQSMTSLEPLPVFKPKGSQEDAFVRRVRYKTPL
jgi:hypothetical protein